MLELRRPMPGLRLRGEGLALRLELRVGRLGALPLRTCARGGNC